MGQGRGQRLWAPPPVPADIPWAAGPGPWEAARAAAAGHTVSAGSREWTAGRCGVGARGCPVAPSAQARFPSRPCWSLAGTGHARGPELHPRPWLLETGGGGRGLRDHPAPNRENAALSGAEQQGIGDRWAWPHQPAEGGARRRERQDPAPGAGLLGEARLAAARGGAERGSLGRSARPGRGVRLMTQQPGEVAPRPFPSPPGCSPPHEPPELGADPPWLAGAGTELPG